MSRNFAETLRRLRTEKGLSQQQLAQKLFVDRSTIASWETGRRVPDAVLISRICRHLDTDVNLLLGTAEKADEQPVVIMADDEKVVLSGGLSVLEKTLPEAKIIGFTKASEAIGFARENKVSVAFLDIEMGRVSGLDICRQLIEINPSTNVIFLTAFLEYAFDAWSTGACGFLLKPLSASEIKKQMERLRYPVRGLEQQ